MKLAFRAFAASLVTFTLVANGTDWPCFRGPDHNGISTETGWSAHWPAEGPKQLWKAKVGTGFSSFAVSKGRVYTMGNDNDLDTVFCFDANTGKELWKHSYSARLDPKYYEGGPASTPTVAGDHVFTLSKQGLVHCLNGLSGDLVWSIDLVKKLKAEMPTWGFAGSVYVEDDLCILNAGSKGTALDRKTGKTVWSSGTDVSGYSTPIPFDARDGQAVIFFVKEDIVAVRVKDGRELWHYPWKTQYDVNAADPILSGDELLISSGYNHGSALLDVSAGAPKLLWERKTLRNQFNPSVFIAGNLYGFDDDALNPNSALKCVEFQTGDVKWVEKTGFGSLMAADRKLIVLTARGELIVADATPGGFKPISRAQVLGGKCWTTPVLSNGKIYCRNIAGDVVCLDVTGK